MAMLVVGGTISSVSETQVPREFQGYPRKGFEVDIVTVAGGASVVSLSTRVVVSENGTALAVFSSLQGNTRFVGNYANHPSATFIVPGGECAYGDAPGVLRQLVVTPAAASGSTLDRVAPCPKLPDVSGRVTPTASSHGTCAWYVGAGDMRTSTLGPLIRELPFTVVVPTSGARQTTWPLMLELPTLAISVFYFKWKTDSAPPTVDFEVPDNCTKFDVCVECKTLPRVLCSSGVCLCNRPIAFSAAIVLGIAVAASSAKRGSNAIAVTYVPILKISPAHITKYPEKNNVWTRI